MLALGNLANGANLAKYQVGTQAAREVSNSTEVNKTELLLDLKKALGTSDNLKDYIGKTVEIKAHLAKGDVTATDVYTVVIK